MCDELWVFLFFPHMVMFHAALRWRDFARGWTVITSSYARFPLYNVYYHRFTATRRKRLWRRELLDQTTGVGHITDDRRETKNPRYQSRLWENARARRNPCMWYYRGAGRPGL
jgi:hypothetical protein